MSEKQIVHRIENDMDRQDVLCTTYQMRNFFRQLGDGFFTPLDVMNYIQHHQVIKWVKSGNHLLDVCCGRGLLLPLLRYHAKNIGSYTGVDIEPKNATFLRKRVTDGKTFAAMGKTLEEYYPFPVRFVHSNVAEMSEHLAGQQFDFLVYTSSIEHMHPDMGMRSLHECRKVARPGAVLFLTCPNTPEGQDGYDTQYRAHVYEWKRSELEAGLKAAGFEIITVYGLMIAKRALKKAAEKWGLLSLVERLEQFVPNDWLVSVFAPFFPDECKEIGFLAKAV